MIADRRIQSMMRDDRKQTRTDLHREEIDEDGEEIFGDIFDTEGRCPSDE